MLGVLEILHGNQLAVEIILMMYCSFLDDIDRISAQKYKPTIADMLRCRVQTTGVTELSFNWKSMTFK